MRKSLITVISIIALFGGLSCSGSASKSYPRFTLDNSEIVAFSFSAGKNQGFGISADAAGSVAGDKIEVTVPHSTIITSLIAEFVTNTGDVYVDSVKQESGVTANDFSSPVLFSVGSEGDIVKEYLVIVNRAPNTEKSFTQYELNGISGVIDETAGTIAVTLPPRSSVTSIAAVFGVLGESVTVNGVEQISGATLNGFAGPVVYRITAGDGLFREYVVTASVEPAPWNEITSFVFLKSDNAALEGDVEGMITGSDIHLILPYGSSPAGITARYSTEGVLVTVDGVTQSSGLTGSDYTQPKLYQVTAENGSVREYTVSVEVARSGAKEITSFLIDDTAGEINESAKTVTVTLAANKVLTSLKPSFSVSGISVTVNGSVQVPGVTAVDFTSPVPYVVSADNGTSAAYTVSAVKSSEIVGQWNFQDESEGAFTVVKAVPVQGVSGQAYSFNGYDSYIQIPDSSDLTLAAAGSIETYIKVTSYSPFAGIVHKGALKDFSDETYSLQFWGDGVIRFSIFNAAGDYEYVESGAVVKPGEWYHLVATWDNEHVSLYINGSLKASTPNTIGVVRDSAGPLVVGAQLNSKFNSGWGHLGFNGVIDGVTVYNRAITESEAAYRYQAYGSTGTALAAYLLMAASEHSGMLMLVFFGITALLAGVVVYNRRIRRHA